MRSLASFYLATDRAPEAEAPLRRIIALEIKTPDDAAWARRLLARVLVASGDPRRAREALTVLGLLDETGSTTARTETGPPPSAEDLRARAAALAAQPDRDQRRAAIRILEDLGRRASLTPDDQLSLSRLHDSVGNSGEARRLALALTAAGRPAPNHLAHAVRLLLSQGRAEEAQTVFDRWESFDKVPPSVERVELRARLLAAGNRGADAIAAIREYAGEDPARLKAGAALLSEIGQGDGAVALIRDYARRSGTPLATLDVARVLARHGQGAEALVLCERAWSDCAPEAVSRASVAVAEAAGPLADEDRARVERRLRAATRAQPDSIRLAVDLATFLQLQGRYDEAEALYRTALVRDPRNVAAMNNLAWLLALRGAEGGEALALAAKAIEVAGPVADLLDTRALAHLARREATPAIDDLDQALWLRPSPLLHFHMARAREEAGDLSASAVAFRKATAGGLRVDDLHPLEHAGFDRLRNATARN